MKLTITACVAVIALAGAAFAQSPSTANAVFVGGTPIMRVRVASGGYSITDRAAQIQERVNYILGIGPIFASDITIQPSGADYVVLVKGHLLFTADVATAQYNQATTQDLAQQWANNMKQVLPSLTAPH